MALLKEIKFSGSSLLTDTHDSIQGRAGKATWISEFNPVVKDSRKLITEALLWLCFNLELCCAIVVDYAMYIAGKLALPPNFLTIYVASLPQTSSNEIAIQLQKQRTAAFSYGSVDLRFMKKYSIPGNNIFILRYGGIALPVKFFCVLCRTLRPAV